MASGNRIVASSWNGLRAVSAPGATTRPSFALRSSPRWALKRRAGFTTAARTRLPSLAATPSRIASRGLATPVEIDDEGGFNLANVERAQDEVDVCIVGGGPAGLSAAIRLKQLEREKGREIRVVVLEKGAEVGEFVFLAMVIRKLIFRSGSHILSGAVIETRALDELIPDWRELGAPLNQPALSDSMRFLTENNSFPMPHPPQMNNKGNYIISLSRFTAWLSEQAEAAGVEVYAGFAGANLVYGEDGKSVKGVVTGDVGLDKNGQPKDSFEPGMEFHAKCVLIAEGAHGSLSKVIQNKFNLREGKDPQTYGLGIKEVWKVRDEVYQPGKVVHTLGWPLDFKTYGGSWLYHMENNMVSMGLVVGLDYENPYLSPYKEFQVRLRVTPSAVN
jgi:electron-transferring-flavoprotein dehydrogenase